MAYVDRGGGRESKNHERRVKRGLAAKANPFAKKESAASALTESPAPQSIAAPLHPMSIVDSGANLLSRHLARDQSRMLQRAQIEHVDACVCFTTDFDKIQELVTTVKAFPGFLYGAYGVHPDNIKRANEKTFASKVTELRSVALSPECVAIFCGLDFGRDMASHYPQAKMVQDHLKLAAELRLPVLLTQVSATERLVEVLRDFVTGWTPTTSEKTAAGAGKDTSGKGKGSKTEDTPKAAALPPWKPQHAVLAFDGDEKSLLALLELGTYISIDGLVCEDSPEGDALRSIVHLIPLNRLLIASNSPLHTPQNITDHYVKTSRNEPSNLPFVLPKLCQAYNAAADPSATPLTTSALAKIVYDNAVTFFQFGEATKTPAASSAAAAKAKTLAKDDKSDAPSTEIRTAEGKDAAIIESLSAGVSESKLEDTSSAMSRFDRVAEDPDELPLPAHAGTEYRCRMCRFPLFTDADIMPHDRNFIRPSARTKANAADDAEAAAIEAAGGEGAGDDAKSVGSGESDVSDDDLLTFIGGRSVAPGRKGPRTIRYYGDTGTVMEIDDTGGVAASRWHVAKGRSVKLSAEGSCRMLLVDRQTWMDYAPTEPEGVIACPNCSAKLGVYNLGGLKCSCGLRVAPAYKIPKNRVDVTLVGVDILDVMAGTDLKRAIIEEEDEEDEEETSDDSEDEHVRQKRKKVPVSKHRGNFSEFRNKTT